MISEPHAVLGAVEDDSGGSHAACVYLEHTRVAATLPHGNRQFSRS